MRRLCRLAAARLILVREKEPEVDQRSQKMPSLSTGDRRFESFFLQRRVRCEPDFGGESHRWPSGISPRRCPSSPQLAPDCQHAFCGDCHGRRYPRRSSGDARGKPEHDLERDVPVEATTSWSQRRSRRAGVGRYAAALQSLVSAGARPSNGDAAHSNGNAAKLRAWLSTRPRAC